MIPDDISFVDVETTGGSFRRDRVIDIGIVRIKKGKRIATYSSLVDPQERVPDDIQEMTGITPQDLLSAPSFRSIADDVSAVLDGSLFVAHNVSFDYAFLKSEFQRIGKTFQASYLCTARLSRLLFPTHRRHNLDSIIERCGLECSRRHRALPDAEVLWDFYQYILNAFPFEQISEAVSHVLKTPSLPIHITENMINTLPESSGVYLFFGEDHAPLYVGKSINIKDRVKSHFSQHHCSVTEWKIAQQVCHIDTVSTPGELGALLKESGLIKELQPLYNKMLRKSYQPILARKMINTKGYWQISLSSPHEYTDEEIFGCLGVFRSKRQATDFFREAALEYHLCDRLLGFQKDKGACFGYQLDRCYGACVGKEPPLSYNERLLSAVKSKMVSTWPFPGAVLIKESGISESCGYLVDKWKYIGTLKEIDGQLCIDKEPHISFDLDVYSILKRYILDAKHQSSIKNISDSDLRAYMEWEY